MSDRDEFEKWAELYIGWNDPDLMRDNDDPDSYLMTVTQHAWMAWQGAKANDTSPVGVACEDSHPLLTSATFRKQQVPVGTKLYTDFGATAPDGWKMVPVTPSDEMCTAAIRAEIKSNAECGEPAQFSDIWDAMLDAAPTPPERGES